MKRVAMIVFWAAVTLCGLWLLWAFRGAAILFLVSIAVAASVRPMIERFQSRGIPLKGAIALTYFIGLAVFGTLTYLIAGRLTVEVPLALDRLAEAYGHASATWPRAGGLRGLVSGLMPAPGELPRAVAGIEPASVAGQALSTTLSLLDALGSILMVLVLSIYWSSGSDTFERLWLSLLPVRQRKAARAVWDQTRNNVGAHLRRELGLSAIASVALVIALGAVGCELWAVATVSILILRLIPLLGGTLAVAAAGLIGAASGPVPALVAAVVTLVLVVALRLVVARRFFLVSRPLDPILAVLVILALAGPLGILGLVVAPFVAVAIQSVFAELIALRAGETEVLSLEGLAHRARRLERKFGRARPPPELASLLSRFRFLLDRADAR